MSNRPLRRPSFRQTVEAAKKANDMYADLSGRPRLDYSQLLKPKRAAPVRNPDRVSEAQVNDMIHQEMTKRADLVLWRNNRGEVMLPDGARIRYGVGPNGAADWLGYRVIRITQEMVGHEIAQFAAVEAKAPDAGHPDEAQQRFIGRVRTDGGLAIVARGREDMEKL